MKIVKERTRIIITEFNELEEHKIDDLVGTIDKVFAYKDPDGTMICFPPGMENSVKTLFPNVSIEDKSKTYWDYAAITPVKHTAEPRNQLQKDFIKFILDNVNKKENVVGVLSPGQGKGLPLWTKIPTPDGYTLMGNLNIGDYVFGSNGKPTKVVGVYDQTSRDVYKITFDDGRISMCDDQHLWLTRSQTNPVWEPRRTIDLVYGLTNNEVYEIPSMSGPVEFKKHLTDIHPYVLGALIGGCYMDKINLTIMTDDDFIPHKISQLCGYSFHKYDECFYEFIDNQTGNIIKTEDILNIYPEMKNMSNNNISIPDIYLHNDYDSRLELLQGIMDMSGEISEYDSAFNITYTSYSNELLEQITYLIRSFGFTTSNKIHKSKNNLYNTIIFNVPNNWKSNLFSHPKKLAIAINAIDCEYIEHKYSNMMIADIELVYNCPTRCIQVDAKDHLYLTQNFIVTHNTFMACYSSIAAGLRTLIIVPTSSIKVQWAETLTKMFNVPEDKVKMINSPKDFINLKCDFAVVSQASLAALNKTYDLERIMKNNKFGIKVIDEVQMWFHNIIKVDANCNILHNWYITGTFGRSGSEENNLYQEMFGHIPVFREQEKKPTIFNRKPGNIYGMKPHMNVKMMWTHSGLSKEEVAKISKTMRYSERAGKWMRYGISIPAYTKLVIPDDGTMTKFLKNVLSVIKIAEREITYGKTLILSPTITSCKIISGYVEKMFPDKKIGLINSFNNKAENARVKAECDIIISTCKSAGTGFDVKGLTKLIVAEQFKSWILTDQVSGRLRKRDDGRDTYMWDIVDADVPQLRAWAHERADVLRRKSKSFKVIDFN